MDALKLEDAVSPLDYRYYGVDERLYAAVHPYLSHAAELRYYVRMEAALADALALPARAYEEPPGNGIRLRRETARCKKRQAKPSCPASPSTAPFESKAPALRCLTSHQESRSVKRSRKRR